MIVTIVAVNGDVVNTVNIVICTRHINNTMGIMNAISYYHMIILVFLTVRNNIGNVTITVANDINIIQYH